MRRCKVDPVASQAPRWRAAILALTALFLGVLAGTLISVLTAPSRPAPTGSVNLTAVGALPPGSHEAISNTTWNRTVDVLVYSGDIPLRSAEVYGSQSSCFNDIACIAPEFHDWFPARHASPFWEPKPGNIVLWIDESHDNVVVALGTDIATETTWTGESDQRARSASLESLAKSADRDTSQYLSYQLINDDLTAADIAKSLQYISDIDAGVPLTSASALKVMAILTGLLVAVLAYIGLRALAQVSDRRILQGGSRLNLPWARRDVVSRIRDTYTRAGIDEQDIELLRLTTTGSYSETLNDRIDRWQGTYVDLARDAFELHELADLTSRKNIETLALIENRATICLDSRLQLEADAQLLETPDAELSARHPALRMLAEAINAARSLSNAHGTSALSGLVDQWQARLDHTRSATPTSEADVVDILRTWDSLAIELAGQTDGVLTAYATKHGRDFDARYLIEGPIRRRGLAPGQIPATSSRTSAKLIEQARHNRDAQRPLKRLSQRRTTSAIQRDSAGRRIWTIPVRPIVLAIAPLASILLGTLIAMMNTTTPRSISLLWSIITYSLVSFGVILLATVTVRFFFDRTLGRRLKERDMHAKMSSLTQAYDALHLEILALDQTLQESDQTGAAPLKILDRFTIWDTDYRRALEQTGFSGRSSNLSPRERHAVASLVYAQAQGLWRLRPILLREAGWQFAWDNETAPLFATIPRSESTISEVTGELLAGTITGEAGLARLDSLAKKQAPTARLRLIRRAHAETLAHHATELAHVGALTLTPNDVSAIAQAEDDAVVLRIGPRANTVLRKARRWAQKKPARAAILAGVIGLYAASGILVIALVGLSEHAPLEVVTAPESEVRSLLIRDDVGDLDVEAVRSAVEATTYGLPLRIFVWSAHDCDEARITADEWEQYRTFVLPSDTTPVPRANVAYVCVDDTDLRDDDIHSLGLPRQAADRYAAGVTSKHEALIEYLATPSDDGAPVGRRTYLFPSFIASTPLP